MTPPDQTKRQVVAEWLRKAQADMALAEHLLAHGAIFPNAIAFHCQQAAEKYLKAFLTWHQIAFPKTHDLDKLLVLVESVKPDMAESLQDVIVLTLYGVAPRYPGEMPDLAKERAHFVCDLARKVQSAVMQLLPNHT